MLEYDSAHENTYLCRHGVFVASSCCGPGNFVSQSGSVKVVSGTRLCPPRQRPKPPKSGLVLGPPKSDGKGGATGSFAIYGGASLIQVNTLSFSGDGKLLAVGSTPGRIDLWDVESRKKLRTLDSGTTVALSTDGSLLAKDGNGIELLDVATGKVRKRIPWEVMTSDPHVQHTLPNLMFNPAGTLLLVSANGMIDSVYDVSSGQLVTTLESTQRAQFSPDGAWLIGGNAKHLIVWNTKDWSKLRDLPNGPDYVTRIAVFPENDLVIVGGPKAARLLHLSTGDEIAKVGNGWTNFAAFNENGTILFTYTHEGFGVWDPSGKRYCFAPDIGNGTAAVSPNDRWLAGGIVNGANSITIWNLQTALTTCGFAPRTKSE
jgi:WD40 repeat protein